MSVVGGAIRNVGRTVNRVATATTSAAGAVGGAAVNGVVGGVKGAAEGIQRGLSTGSDSTPAAALAIGALGVAGLVEWPILLAVGGGALLLRKMNPATAGARAPAAKLAPVPNKPEPVKPAPGKSPSKSTTKTTKTTKTTAKKTAGRRAGSANLRSTN